MYFSLFYITLIVWTGMAFPVQDQQTTVYLIMGVSGCGKTTIATQLAKKFEAPFVEADDFHSTENKLRMSQGLPLQDEHRWPWLNILTDHLTNLIEKHPKKIFFTCSALKESYRDLLRKRLEQLAKFTIIYLAAPDTEILQKRLESRKNHFMNSELMQSQLNTLEEPKLSEGNLITLNIQNQTLEQTIEFLILAILKENAFQSML